ncbi:anti-sigma factor family protein [Jatrophihabitans fulvus]
MSPLGPLGPLGPQHLSDEAVAACADGVLTGHARSRAMRHVAECAECAEAVREQRETASVLRSAPSPDLPSDLLDRLRGLPAVTPVTVPPTVVMPDGSTMLSTSLPASSRGRLNAPVAAFVDPSAGSSAPGRRRRAPFTVLAAAAVLVGAAATAAAAPDDPTPGRPGTDDAVRTVQHRTDGTPGAGATSLLPPVGLFGPGGR